MRKSALQVLCLLVFSVLGGLFSSSCGDEAEEGTSDLGTDDLDSEVSVANRCEGVPMRPDNLFEAVGALKAATAAVENPGSFYLAMVIPYMSDFWTTPQLGVGHAAEELLCSINFVGPDGESEDPGGDQKQIVDDLIEDRVDALGISCKDAALLESSIAEGIASNIPVITFDADGIEGSRRHLYLGTVNTTAGKTAGNTMVDLLGDEGGSVVLLLNSAGDSNLVERKTGIEAAFEGTGVELVETYAHEGDMEQLALNIQTAIEKYPDLGGIISINGHIGPVLGKELVRAGKEGQIKAVAFDLLFDTQEHLRNGAIDAVIVQQSYFFGYLGVHILFSMASIGVQDTLNTLSPWLDGPIFDTGTQVLTGENIDQYEDLLECLGVSES